MTPIQKLDFVFNQFVSTDDIPGYTRAMIEDGIKDNKIDIGNIQLIEILHKIKKDEYVRVVKGDLVWRGVKHPETDFYVLTFEGELFKLSGGYTQQAIDTANAKRRAKLYECQLLWATAFAGIGATGILVWEIAKWSYHHFQWMHIFKFWS